MTQIFNEEDKLIPVTVIQAEPNTVCQVKTKATDGYEAVQLGFGEIKAKKVNKPMGGHFAKQGIEPTRYLREVRVEDAAEYQGRRPADRGGFRRGQEGRRHRYLQG